MICLQQNLFFFLSELHMHTLWPIKKRTIKRSLNTTWPKPIYIWRELQFTQLNSFPNSIFKGRMSFQGLTTDKVKCAHWRNKRCCHLCRFQCGSIHIHSRAEMILPKNMTYSVMFPGEYRGCGGRQGVQWGMGRTAGRRRGGKSAGSWWWGDEGVKGRGCSGKVSGHRKHLFLHGWEEKRDKEQEQGDVRRQGLAAGYVLWSCSCSEDNPQMTHSWLCSAWKGTIAWWARCTKAIFPSEGTSWLLIAKTWLKISLKTKLCFFSAFSSWELLFSLVIKAGSWANAETKGRHCLKYSLQESWKSTFSALLAQTILVLLSWTARAFSTEGQSKSLCVLVKNGNLVYKEWFNLDLVKKIKPALKYHGKLHFNFEEATNAKGQIHDGVTGQIRKEILVSEGECHLNPKPWSAQLNSTALCLLPESSPALTIYPTEAISPYGKEFGVPYAQWHSIWRKKALSGCLPWLTLQVRVRWGCPQQTSRPSPLPLLQPTAHGARGELIKRCKFRPFWDHSQSTVSWEKMPPQESRGMAVPVYKEGPPRLEGAAAANAQPQMHPLPEIFSVEPATASAREQRCTNAMLCTVSSARLSRGRRSLRPVKVVLYMPQARAAVAAWKAHQNCEPSCQRNEC